MRNVQGHQNPRFALTGPHPGDLWKAAVLKALRQPFQIESVPDPAIGPDEVLVQTRTCGICRTDLHIQDGLAYVPALPHIPGHEPAGVVAAVGANVRHLKIGQVWFPICF